MDDSLFQQHLFDGQFNPVIGPYIDPNLQSSPSDPYQGQWGPEPPLVKRWISEEQKAFFNADPYANVMNPVARSSVGTRPVPPASQVRFASPISSSDHGLTAPSPLAETESFYGNSNLPSTPSDTAVLSPSYHPEHFEYYNSEEAAIQFGNMGPTAPPAYVKPEDVDPSQQLGYHDDVEASQPHFSFYPRTDSFESGTSHSEAGQPNPQSNQMAIGFKTERMASPEDMRPVKLEGQTNFQYPPPSDGDADDDASDVPEERPVSKRKKEEDDLEYTPGKKIKSSGASSPRRTRAKPVHSKPSGERSPKPKPTVHRTSTAENPPPKSGPSSSANKTYSCHHCKHAPFKDQPSLDSHIKKQHTRPFKCVFHFAGCESTFASKNEWKRHNTTQHLVLNYWLCTEGICGKSANGVSPTASASSAGLRQQPPRTGSSTLYSNTFNASHLSSTLPQHQLGAQFNRKDLYTQHVRRMHMSPNIKKDIKLFDSQSKSQPASTSTKSRKGQHHQPQLSPQETSKRKWEDDLKLRQETAKRDRIEMPEYMRCPATGCHAEFRGKDSWDQRMEHVARHLESGDRGNVEFGGVEDETLTGWAGRGDVGVIVWEGGRWVLGKVMGRGGSGAGGGSGGGRRVDRGVDGLVIDDDGERDAEGEEDDEM
ncbi:hypothetical protein GE09DRAFT_1217235 [Coniochaeta sp. 2T2.1]|nr:hypothetical protein GE09DRAFT_1217235 [Coniochaeta sp. 2T2.1]